MDSGAIFHYGSDPEDLAANGCDQFGVRAGGGGNPDHEDVADPLPSPRREFGWHAAGEKSLFNLPPRAGWRASWAQGRVILILTSSPEPRKIKRRRTRDRDQHFSAAFRDSNRPVDNPFRVKLSS